MVPLPPGKGVTYLRSIRIDVPPGSGNDLVGVVADREDVEHVLAWLDEDGAATVGHPAFYFAGLLRAALRAAPES